MKIRGKYVHCVFACLFYSIFDWVSVDWYRDKKGKPWFLPCLNPNLSKMPREDW